MIELKKITILVLLGLLAWTPIVACGVTSDDGTVVTESGDDETGELDEGEPCASGVNNHLNNGTCYCDEGFNWCNANDSFDCCLPGESGP